MIYTFSMVSRTPNLGQALLVEDSSHENGLYCCRLHYTRMREQCI